MPQTDSGRYLPEVVHRVSEVRWDLVSGTARPRASLSYGMTPDAKLPDEYEIPEDGDALVAECRVETFRSGGPGGQHQNKTESGVRLTHLPTGISVIARDSRSQHRNRQIALTRLREALEEASRDEATRIPTKTPRRERRKRLEEKRRRSEVKRARQKPKTEE